MCGVFYVLFVCLLFEMGVSLCSPECPGTHSVGQVWPQTYPSAGIMPPLTSINS